MKHLFSRVAIIALGLFVTSSALADTVILPDATQSTTFTATVAEQITVTVPSGVAFSVDDVNSATAASAATITITSMALLSGNHLQISIAPDADAFTAPAGGTTWAASDVSWNAATGTAITGSSGTMGATAGTYAVVANCDANAAACSTSDLVFTLAAKASVDQAGDHTLAATWKFESL
ncbi:MAG: hypothetical protein CVU56_01320 [Deltaproteobacteria bacterium HGW-Deltaproteobacteria-14]|jgi:hypothetical protein|nr:MAG: hypothetical protein CVU56_01320 [Deltaproteobacteria bacterium HGW-Deltaproteobacteria-14]